MKTLNSQLVKKVCASILAIIVLFIFVSTTSAQEQAEDMRDVKIIDYESELEELITTVYCYCGCTRETIKACVCPTAQNVETDFRNKLLRGDTVDEIRTEYLEKWGPQFSAVMKNLIAYIMPAVILIAIGGVIFIVRHQSRGNKLPSTQHDNQISDELQQQVEAELEKYKEQN